MCRHLAYLGPPVRLAELVFDPPHSLVRQTWSPADMRGGGAVNADGFGIGWYDGSGGAVRYRRACPMWADGSLPGLASSIESRAVLAATRNGTAGLPVVETACAPFAEGRWLFSHNGRIEGWPSSVAGLAGGLPLVDVMTLDAPTDSALLWALVRQRLRTGEEAGAALAGAVRDVAAAAPGSRLNLLLTDGETITATTWTHSLSVLSASDRVLLSSEPLTPADERWIDVPDARLVVATAEGVDMRPLDGGKDSSG